MFLFTCECGCMFTVKKETITNHHKNYFCQNCITKKCFVAENENPVESSNVYYPGVYINKNGKIVTPASVGQTSSLTVESLPANSQIQIYCQD